MGNNPTVLYILKRSQWKPGSVVVITGASSGIGREMAYRYACRGSKLVLASRRVKELNDVAQRCLFHGSEAIVVCTDVSIEEDCKHLVEESLRHFGTIDIMVLNAGIVAHFSFSETVELSIYQSLLQTNFFGYVACVKYAWPALKKSKGQIVVISSVSGELGLPHRSAYCASKFAVTGFFEALRTEHRDEDVAITVACPPSVKTELRVKALTIPHQKLNESPETVRMSVQKCVDMILLAADRRARKVMFPLKAYLAFYVRYTNTSR
eukprot:GHVL01032185.1.p1 GENE.GHVL01032185.1~~GHVL01032185.1.p1  ORF type:complete len:266 (+),score=33.70 GHVL01032185.1:22-819(+)